jgi:ATP-dependent DNA helicase RecG
VIELELRRGCDDGAVIGGMDRFLEVAKQDAQLASMIDSTVRPSKPYRDLPPASRERWLRALLNARASRPSPNAARPEALAGRVQATRSDTQPEPASSGIRGDRSAPAGGERSGSARGEAFESRVNQAARRPQSDPLDAPVTVVKGVKGAMQARLANLDVYSVRDLLYLFPNRHHDYADIRPISELAPDENQTAVVSVWSASVTRLGRREGTRATVGDDAGTMSIVWFNQPYVAGQLHTNDRIVVAGKVSLFNRQKTMENPDWERLQSDDLTHTGRLVPVYPLTQGLYQRSLRRVVKEAVDRFSGLVKDPLPLGLRERHALPELRQALRQMHYPDSTADYERARRRVAFEELLCVQLAVLERRLAWQEGRAAPMQSVDVLQTFRDSLPWSLTLAQERVLGEITADLEGTRPMARLLQGDVGSGKTAVAAAALLIANANNFQGALMAPTEILAEQHYNTLRELLGRMLIAGHTPRVELLTGSLSSRSKQAAVDAVASGEVDIAVGTHALIQEGVSFQRLGVAVVDEQHRFGVMQRAALKERAANGNADYEAARSEAPSRGEPHVRGEPVEPREHSGLTRPSTSSGRTVEGTVTPHLLVMSATPIPRTLALTLYGDLDVSVIDQMPPGRLPVQTRWVGPTNRAAAYAFVRDQIKQGRQAFVVCPLIEESAALQTRSAVQEYERLSTEVFPDLRLGLLHGRMSAADKDAVLQSFREGALHILVATTVIEVGIDIPNASVMVIEGADRFGLAQLHQLRGRVGRGADQSYCLLLSDDPSEVAMERLQLMADNSDGFALAEADLRLRGPGDYFGTRQSGLPEFHAADFSDIRLIETVRQEAIQLLRADPELAKPQHHELSRAVRRVKRIVTGEVG